MAYQRAVPQERFLRKLRELLPWEALTQEWVALYKGGAEYGPPPYHPALVLKMLFGVRLAQEKGIAFGRIQVEGRGSAWKAGALPVSYARNRTQTIISEQLK